MGCIRVKWGHDDPNPRAVKARRIEIQGLVDTAVDKRIAALGLSESELANMQLAGAPKDYKDVVAPYPDTSAQYPDMKKASSVGPLTSSEAASEAARARVQAEAETSKAMTEAE